MCFSLKVSLFSSACLFFVASFLLKKSPKNCLFYIPFFFAIQQLAEAGVWATFDYDWGLQWRNLFSYSFLFFAFIIWPVWIPYSFYKLERDKRHQKILRWIFFLGIIISVYLLCQMLTNPITITVVRNSISYYLDSTNFVDNIYLICIYAFIVISPCFVSTLPRAKVFGILLFLSLVVSCLIYYYAFTSVWCFFAAILSSAIYFAF